MDARDVNKAIPLLNSLNLHKNTIRSLWQLSKQQNNFIKAKDFKGLFASRHEKELLLQNLKKWSTEIRYYYENRIDWQDQITEKERNRLTLLVEKINEIVEKMLIVENENRMLLEQRRDELSLELGTINFYQDCLYSIFENQN